MKNKIIAVVLAVLMIFGTSMTVFAQTQPSKKDEVVYAMADASGNIKGVYVVNSFTDKSITDYGNYSTVKNLTTSDKIDVTGGRITVNSSAEKLYYQGDMDSTDIPWNFEIKYFLDDREYSPSEIAGKSGALKIKINVTQNKNCDSSFYKGFCLQATVVLDGEKCTNIASNNATIANVGSNKQLSYIIIPDKGANLEITADVKDFEMEAISINALKMNLSLDFESDELSKETDKIKKSAKKLNKGAKKINDASDTLSDGSGKLYDGTQKISDGAGDLNDGISTLSAGVKEVRTALQTVDSKSKDVTNGSAEVLAALNQIDKSLEQIQINTSDIKKLTEASAQIKSGIDSLVYGLQKTDGGISEYYAALNKNGITDINNFVDKHKQAVTALDITDTQRALYSAYVENGNAGVVNTLATLVQSGDEEAVKLYTAYASSGDMSVITDYVTNAGKLISIETLLKADIAYIQGSNQLISSIDAQLDEQNGQIMTGALALQKNYAAFDASINSLADSLQAMASNMLTLKSAISTLAEKYALLDSGVNDYTNGVAKILVGYEQLYNGAVKSANGSATLYNSANSLVKNTAKLYDGSKKLSSGTSELCDGTSEFVDKTKDIDKTVEDKINDTVDDITGKNVQVKSFVSDKNTNISSVLFVIKTDAVEIPEKETAEFQVKPLTFWQKLIALFKKE